MKDRINSELLNLQEELQKLGQAVTHIKKAEDISTNVVENMKGVQENYKTHLDKLAELFKESLDNYKQNADQNLAKMQEINLEQLSESKKLISEIQQKSNLIEEKAQETLKNAAQEYDNFLDKNFLHTKHQMEQVAQAYQKRIDEESEILAEFTRLTQKTEQVNKDYVEKQLSENSRKIGDLINSHQTNVEKTNSLLSQYEDLGKATAILYQKISQIDFPTHLSNINLQVEHLSKNIGDYTKKIQSIENQFQKSTKEVNNLKYMVIIVLIFVVALAFDVAIKYL